MVTTRSRGKQAAGAAVVLLLATGLGAWWLWTRDAVITVGQDELQQRLTAAFPIQKSLMGIGTLTLSHPVISLPSGSDRVGFAVDAAADALGGALHDTGTGRMSARVRFVPQSRALFLDDTRVESLTLGGLPPQYQSLAALAAGLAAREYFSSHPLLTVKRPVLSSPFGDRVVKNVAIEQGALKVTLGRPEAP